MQYTERYIPSKFERTEFILEFYRDKNAKNYHDKDLIEQACIYFDFTEEQIQSKITEGGQTFKRYLIKARNELRIAGDLWMVKKGHYEITKKGLQNLNNIIQEQPLKNNNILQAATEIGIGQESVYVFSYPAYRKLAEQTNQRDYEHKIGHTKSKELARISQQVTTGMPEKPEVLLQIKTDDSVSLERAIHAILKLRGKHNKESLGSEWFITNCKEITDIYLFICNKLPRDQKHTSIHYKYR